MAIQTDIGDVGGLRDGPAWNDVLTVSNLGAGIFDVRWDVRPRLRRWLAGHDLPCASTRDPHLPAVDAWALLDGGVISVASLAVGPHDPDAAWQVLSPGMRVLGFRAFRLLVAQLALAGPATVLPGEQVTDPDALRAEFENRRDDGAAREQAELLASCTDRSSTRWVAAVLRSGPPAGP
ncbi:hypothetical protein EV383_4007 [Pseudonocardia sediminis]|uniref:Uncharacterized protein n=1 Tax=Pseudonocardia sediminis TaxID=1397368 RepID=A0A4V2FR40_PSEST|nr:hypothetical protein [Pseudonocardia sediminis]RZT87100.1 hypothetical protein EV383_4007 [Pseudonocardia sediminis]